MRSILCFALLFSPLAAEEPPKSWIDPDTGHRVLRLTQEPGSASLYFNQNGYTADGREMVYTTSNPPGISVLYLKTLVAKPVVSGRVRIIVTGHKTQNVYYMKGDAVYSTDVDSGVTREIAKLPPHGSIATVNADETLLAGTYTETAPDQNFGNAISPQRLEQPRNKGQMMEERLAAHIPMGLFIVDARTGEVKTIHKSTDWLNHLEFSPTDPTLLMFCHEGPWHKVDRIWTIRTDGTHLTKIHTRTMEMEIFGHEFWSPDGKTIWYDLQTPRSEVFWLAGYNVETGERTWYHLDRNEWSIHFNVSRDGALFCGDGGDPGQVAHAKDGQWIYLFRPELVKNRGVEDPKLIKPGVFHAERLVNMAKHQYHLEPNVSFSPDQKWVVFRSNMFGATYAFAVEIAKADTHEQAAAAVPTLFLIGDSTVRNGRGDGANGQWGWGEALPAHFDLSRIQVLNRAIGGRSSRTFLTDGHWDEVSRALRPGDFVIMQFGHNDGGPLDDKARARGTLPGIGEETREIENPITGKHEVVHTYGWYLRQMIAGIRAKGASPIVCSPVPRKIWKDGKVARSAGTYEGWASQVAESEKVPFIDLNEIIAERYDEMGPKNVEPLFADEHTHTSRAGAELNAECVIAGLKALKPDPLAAYLK